MVNAIRKSAFTISNNRVADGLYVVNRTNANKLHIPHLPVLPAAKLLAHLADGGALDDGDIVYVDNRHNRVRNVLAKKANANTLLLTERCENRCQFCSQPPNEHEDSALYQAAALALLNFNATDFVGLSGGEPTINRHAFITLLRQLKEFNNKTKLHILTNGRNFADQTFTRNVVTECHDRDIVWGIPLYGHCSDLHDRLVGAKGAFALTLQGILHLLSVGQYIELRIVPVRENIHYLPHIVTFLMNAFAPLGVISIMQMEPKGWARKNYPQLHVPVEAQNPYLEQAVQIAGRHGQSIRLFNYPICLLPESLRSYACQSISDWKNYYPDDCRDCSKKSVCGGFFTSAIDKFIEKVLPL